MESSKLTSVFATKSHNVKLTFCETIGIVLVEKYFEFQQMEAYLNSQSNRSSFYQSSYF